MCVRLGVLTLMGTHTGGLVSGVSSVAARMSCAKLTSSKVLETVRQFVCCCADPFVCAHTQVQPATQITRKKRLALCDVMMVIQ